MFLCWLDPDGVIRSFPAYPPSETIRLFQVENELMSATDTAFRFPNYNEQSGLLGRMKITSSGTSHPSSGAGDPEYPSPITVTGDATAVSGVPATVPAFSGIIFDTFSSCAPVITISQWYVGANPVIAVGRVPSALMLSLSWPYVLLTTCSIVIYESFRSYFLVFIQCF
jgi:hypothetical protein